MTDGNSWHPDNAALAAWLDGRLSEEERLPISAHLAQCDECRGSAVDAVRALAHTDRPPRRWWVGLAAAAAIVVLLIPLIRAERPDVSPLRTVADSAPLLAYGPIGEVSSAVRLSWASAGNNATYRVSLADSTGELVWSAEVQDTLVDLPADLDLGGERGFLWWADALLPDGETRSTGVRMFRVVP